MSGKTIECRAATEYGYTDNPYDAGYILPTGEMLDFSEGAGMGRIVDHRNVAQFFNYDNTEYAATTKQMIKFMRRGNIRVMPEGKCIEFSKAPTSAQLRTIRDIAEWFGDDMIIEKSTANGNSSTLIGGYHDLLRVVR